MTRILVVEDERVIAAGLRDNLELEGYEVEVVGDGLVAESRARSGTFDLILLDLMLPGKNGLAVCRSLHESGLRTPTIILTAKGQESDKVTGLELGADDYITKPFGQRELLARIKALLRRSVEGIGAAADPYESDGFRIDFRRFEGTIDGSSLGLTAIEFKLLSALVHRRGEVVTLQQMVDAVWGKDYALSERVIYTHVNNLRAKIGHRRDGGERISTVRGFGYRFDG
ncbi:MAG: response regulator transcription factor [Acidobacteria bacterium]|nr:response regulator transcription factor [Acidobacteriota bacterium]